MIGCPSCVWLARRRDETERLWAVARAELAVAAKERNAPEHGSRKGREANARIDAFIARLELSGHRKVHVEGN